ncbi:MAG: PIN domain-containing protein [Chloroflexota bacterium]|nr:PIN domain-containing protein [Chloroflexota bacterium]MDE2894622.1 PIN domain-containing protein [Chloroflexota bacterium]
MTAYLDTNVVVRHITGEPRDQASRASAYLDQAVELLLPDLIVAEVAYVLESFYGFSRSRIAESVRSVILSEAVVVTDAPVLLRAFELYDSLRLDFPDAYIAALAEGSGVLTVASFDRDFDRIDTIHREEPA